MTASVALATVRTFKQLKNGAQFAAWIGLAAPAFERRHANLGAITKRGGTAPALSDLTGGQIDVMFDMPVSMLAPRCPGERSGAGQGAPAGRQPRGIEHQDSVDGATHEAAVRRLQLIAQIVTELCSRSRACSPRLGDRLGLDHPIEKNARMRKEPEGEFRRPVATAALQRGAALIQLGCDWSPSICRAVV